MPPGRADAPLLVRTLLWTLPVQLRPILPGRRLNPRGCHSHIAFASTLKRFRVFDNVECSGGFSAQSAAQNDRSEIESVHRQAVPHFEPIPYPTISIRKYTPRARRGRAALLRIERPARRFRKIIKPVLLQQRVQRTVKRVAQCTNLIGDYEQRLLRSLASFA